MFLEQDPALFTLELCPAALKIVNACSVSDGEL